MNKWALYGIVLLMQGCVATTATLKLTGFPPTAVEDRKTDFVELFDGTIIEGIVSPEKSRNKFIVISGKSYHIKTVKSFQFEAKYKTTFKGWYITRQIKGNINLYSRDKHSQEPRLTHPFVNTYETLYFLQKGQEGTIEKFSVGVLEQMVSDNQKAAEWIKQYRKLKNNATYLDSAIKEYNLK